MPTVGVEFAKVSYTVPVGAEGQAERVLVRDVSLQLEAGTTTALLGRSGAGKTTLLRMVNGLVTPTSGEVLVAGKPTRDYHGMALELAGRAHFSKAQIKTRVREVLALSGLDFEEFRGRYPWQLSGGQRQRVGLARALTTDPTVLLMDEPFGALDPLTRAEMQTMLRDLLKRAGKTVLLVTHDLDEALFLAGRVVFLSEGTVVADLAG